MSKRKLKLPVKGVVPIDQMVGEDDEDTRLLREMASEASEFLGGFAWCEEILDAYYGHGCGGIVAVFFYRIKPSRADVDKWLWVVVGDIPSAHLVTDWCKLPSQALEGYIEEMSEWVKLAKEGQSSEDVIPVDVAATPDNAANLEGRLQ